MNIDSILSQIVSGTITLRDALEQMSGPAPESKVQIVIAPRGWVFVGYCSKDDSDLIIERSNVIRIWGTTKGIGELKDGPTDKTVLDPCGTTRVPLTAVLARIDCEESKWNTRI
jgi:hypothetical protein